MMTNDALAPETPVSHPVHGAGRVVADAGATVVARFGDVIHAVLKTELALAQSLDAGTTAFEMAGLVARLGPQR